MERQSLIFLSVLVFFSLACGLIDDDATNITFTEEVSQSFTIDADRLCPQDMDCSEDSVSAPQDEELEPVETAADIDVVEATGREDLRDYTGVFRSIEIVAIDYAVAQNSLTFDLPQTTLYLGPMGITSKDHEDAVELATIDSVPAGTNKSGQARVAEDGRAASADMFQNLELSSVVFAQPIIKEGQPLPPSGTASMKLTFHIRFTANPQDAL